MAATALQKHDDDIVNAIMEITLAYMARHRKEEKQAIGQLASFFHVYMVYDYDYDFCFF